MIDKETQTGDLDLEISNLIYKKMINMDSILLKYFSNNENKINNSLIDFNAFSKIVIYQFGKVGSSSLKETFKSLGKRTIHSHNWKNEYLFSNQGRSLIINVVRNIKDRNISALFQNINNKNELNFYYNKNLDNFDNLSLHFEKCHKKEMEWMKNYYKNFENLCGISIFDKEFNIDEPYLFFPKAKCNSAVLILRFEDINEWPLIFKKIFGFKINLIDSNRSENKQIYPIYKNFKKNYVFNDNLIEEIWNIDFMKFFYPIDYLEYCENNKLNEN